MTTAAATPTSALHHARQVVGMAILAPANPLVWYSHDGVGYWLGTLLVPVVIALVLFGLYALLFAKRAKDAWPKSFFMLAWVLLVLTLAGAWMSVMTGEKGSVAMQAPIIAPNQASNQPANSQSESGGKTFTYEEAFGLPPEKK